MMRTPQLIARITKLIINLKIRQNMDGCTQLNAFVLYDNPSALVEAFI